MSTTCTGRRTGGGFTLVEVMVVIAVVVLLLSILLPMNSKAHEAAMTAVCAANLRELNVAMRNTDPTRGRKTLLPSAIEWVAAATTNGAAASLICPADEPEGEGQTYGNAGLSATRGYFFNQNNRNYTPIEAALTGSGKQYDGQMNAYYQGKEYTNPNRMGGRWGETGAAFIPQIGGFASLDKNHQGLMAADDDAWLRITFGSTLIFESLVNRSAGQGNSQHWLVKADGGSGYQTIFRMTGGGSWRTWADPNSPYIVGIGAGSSYGMNNVVRTNGAYGRQVMLADYETSIIMAGGNSAEFLDTESDGGLLADRHLGRVNVLYVDSSVELEYPEYIQANRDKLFQPVR